MRVSTLYRPESSLPSDATLVPDKMLTAAVVARLQYLRQFSYLGLYNITLELLNLKGRGIASVINNGGVYVVKYMVDCFLVPKYYESQREAGYCSKYHVFWHEVAFFSAAVSIKLPSDATLVPDKMLTAAVVARLQ